MTHAAAARSGAETDAWLRSAFTVLTAVSGVHRVGVALVEGGGRRLSFAASDRDPGGGADWCEVDAYEDVPLNKTVRTGRLVAGTLEGLAARFPDFIGRQSSTTHALASVPLAAVGQVLGGFALFYGTRQLFDAPQLEELELLGARLGADLRRSQRTRTLPSRALSAEPVPPDARVASRRISPDPHEVPAARHFAQAVLESWGVADGTVETVLLCLSELVTNAVIHTDTGCEVQLVLHRGVLTASVRDGGVGEGGTTSGLVSIEQDPLAVHGRGLRLVEALTARWGSELDAVGMTVWCAFEVA